MKIGQMLGAVLLFGLTPQVTTPAPGSEARTAILDAVRPTVEAKVGTAVKFEVYRIRVLGTWAFVLLHPQRPDGQQIDWTSTQYGGAWQAGSFQDRVAALLHRSSGQWVVYTYNLGGVGVVWSSWAADYHAPARLFPGNK